MTPGLLPPVLEHSTVLRSVIESLPEDDSFKAEDDGPVFILASGFRSGSTLTQRLVMSEGALIWGEPFMETGWLHGLATTLMHLPGRLHGWAEIQRKLQRGPLHDQWVSNLHPGVQQLRHAHCAMIQTLLADPTRKTPYTRWGAKFVRLDGNFARYLQWLFPNARFIICVRDPLASFHSYRRYLPDYATDPQQSGWMVTPNWRINTAERFFAIAHHLMGSLIEAQAENPNAMTLLRYEDMMSGKSRISALGDWLGMHLKSEVLDQKLDGAMRQASPEAPLTETEKATIDVWNPRFKAFGYGAP